MRDEIERIFTMVENGSLTREQAAEMLEALKLRESQSSSNDAHRHDESFRSRSHKSRHRRHRRRSRGKRADPSIDQVFEELGEEIQQIVDMGSKVFRGAFIKSSLFSPSDWVNQTNTSTFAKVEEPQGQDFECLDNQITVSQIRNLILNRSEFCNNEFNAAAIADVEVFEGAFCKNALRGSSLKKVLSEQGAFSGNQINGAQLSRFTLKNAQFADNTLNGAQIRELGMVESSLERSHLNGVRLRSLVLRDETRVSELNLHGVFGKSWLLEGAALSDLRLTGLKIDGLHIDHSGLEKCSIRSTEWTERLMQNEPLLVDQLTLQRVIMRNCHFNDCIFDGTLIKDCQIENLTFDKVDFSDLTLSSSDELIKLARQDAA